MPYAHLRKKGRRRIGLPQEKDVYFKICRSQLSAFISGKLRDSLPLRAKGSYAKEYDSNTMSCYALPEAGKSTPMDRLGNSLL